MLAFSENLGVVVILIEKAHLKASRFGMADSLYSKVLKFRCPLIDSFLHSRRAKFQRYMRARFHRTHVASSYFLVHLLIAREARVDLGSLLIHWSV